MIYLASPYSHTDQAIEIQRFDAVCQAAATLMMRGVNIFSPIAHSHAIARFGLPTDWAYWQHYDRAFIAWCDELWVLTLPGWKQSVGVLAEVRIAEEAGKPVRLIDSADVALGAIVETAPTEAGAVDEVQV